MSEPAGASEKPSYRQTLCLLGKAEADAIFPQRANLAKREPAILKFWEDERIYHRIRDCRTGAPRFILHDGPPYANGHIHLGTALNKILKDITVRSQTLAGQDAPYVPGWDCHGLPIEHKVMQEIRKEGKAVGTLELRRRCRDYGLQFIDVMTEDFKRLGVLGEWEKPYITLNPEFEAHELRLFSKLVERGMVYRSLKPVYWCPGYQTALAEAEVEYLDHTSPSIYVKFPSIDVEEALGPDCGDPAKPLSVLIWTTTPWTLPANLGIALHPEFEYAVMETDTDRMVVARDLAESVAREAHVGSYTVHNGPRGGAFEGKKCRHPFVDRESLLILGAHVTLETGSGCVHTAPGHGHEDYLAALQYGLDIYSPVDDEGKFTADFPDFCGVFVMDANTSIVELLRSKGALLWESKLTHSYPHDWREKKPVIFRATPQWFISMERADLRNQLMSQIEGVQWIPKWGKERIRSMLDNRVEWCISRQRTWGVPIPAIHLKEQGEAILDPWFIRKLADLVEETGVDVWFEALEGVSNKGTERLRKLVEETLREKGQTGEWRLEKDTLDVWFDSGSTHQAVLNDAFGLSYPADLYLEGSDQHRGWFQSSLITAVAAELGAPYRAVLTHGFFVDEQGEKMSKTKGNYIETSQAVEDYGADVLRLWVASEDFRNDISVSTNILKQRSEAYRRFRNTFRFILCSLYDFSLEDRVPDRDLFGIDRYEIEKWRELESQIRRAYDTYEFHRVYHLANAYCTVDLSARYLDILKDRLYTFRKDSLARRSAQTALLRIMRGLVQSLSPLLAFTCEEAWQALRRMGLVEEESVALTCWAEREEEPDREILDRWDWLFELRDGVNAAVEPLRKEGKLGQSLEAAVEIWFRNEAEYRIAEELLQRPSGDDLPSLLIVSAVQCHSDEAPKGACIPERPDTVGVNVALAQGDKCVRCWRVVPRRGADPQHPEICDRCLEAISGA